jgi:hypothetical protein
MAFCFQYRVEFLSELLEVITNPESTQLKTQFMCVGLADSYKL